MNIRKTAIVITALALAATGSAYGGPSAQASTNSAACPAPVVAAHRGGNYYTASTARNFAASAQAGAHVWETDARFTRTNYPFLLHDADLGLFGRPDLLIANETGMEVGVLHAPDGSNPETVNQFGRQLFATPGQTGLVELKVAPTAAQWTLFDARMKPLGKRVWIASFDPAVVRTAQAHGYQTAQIDAATTRRTAAAVRSLGNAYEAQYDLLTATFTAQLKAAGVTVYAWTSDTPASWTTDTALGVVPLTDDPSGYLAWYKANQCR